MAVAFSMNKKMQKETSFVKWRSDLVASSQLIYMGDRPFNHDALTQQVDQLARYLHRHSVTAGDSVALLSSSSWLLNLLIYVSFEQGITICPLDPKMPEQWRKRALKKANINFLLSYDASGAEDIDIGALSVVKLYKGGMIREPEAGLALVIATSGVSGEPKGVILSRDAIYHSAMVVNNRLGLGAADCWLNCLPLHHIGGVSIIFRTALASASMVLHEGFDAVHVWRDIKRYRVTHLSLVPVMLAKLLDVADTPPPEWLKVVLIGGAALDEALAQRALVAGWPLFVTYGMSETASQVATAALTLSSAVNDPIPLLDGMACRIIDDGGLNTDGVGQICLRGDMVMRGYTNAEQRVGEGLDDEGWYITGDIGRYHPSSGIQIMGRADEVIISGGENIHPQQVEQWVRSCPDVDEICILGIKDSQWGERVCMAYSGDATEPFVEQWCRDNIDGALRPRMFVRLAQLPRLTNGKIDRSTLRSVLL